jgi:uncharacterized membrane protein required for colicin V production
MLAALVVAKLFHADVAEKLKDYFEFFGTLDARLFEKLTEHFSVGEVAPMWVGSDAVASALNLPGAMVAEQTATGMVNEALFSDLSVNLANALTKGVAFAFVFLGAMLALLIIGVVTSAISELPLLKQANRLAGLLLGVVLGVLNVWILITVMTFMIPFMKSTWMIDAINGSALGIEFYNHNVLLYLLYYLVKS